MLSDAFTRHSTGGHECAGICGGDEQNAFFADRRLQIIHLAQVNE
jgi:hypothetical protein